MNLLLLVLLAAPPAPAAEARVVEYLKARVRPGEPVVVSELYNSVFTAPDERAALDRLFDTFFRIPLYAARQQKTTGRPPSLAEIGEQFHFLVPGETELMLRVMESDPRMPRFFDRDARTGEITRVDVEAVLAHPRFGRALERTISGWEGRAAPAFETTTADGRPLRSAELAGKPHVLYFWFTGCPPCLKTAPALAELDRAYAAKGLSIVGLNADRALELPYGEEQRRAYAADHGLAFTMAEATPAVLEAHGGVSVFPTIFVVDAKGTVVRQLVNAQDRATLEAAVRLALP